MKFTVKAAPFGAALLNVLPHAATDDTLPALNAVEFSLIGNTLTMAATDRYSLGVQTVEVLEGDYPEHVDGEALVPLDFCKEVAKQAKAAKLGFLNLDASDGLLRVEWPAGSGSGRLLEATFPKWERLFPTDEPTPVAGIGLGPWHVGKFAKMYNQNLTLIKHAALFFTFHGERRAAAVSVTGLEDFRALIQPVTK